MEKWVKKIGVVGAGQMGRGIVQVAAQKGYSVLLFDVKSEQLIQAMALINKQLEAGVLKNKWTNENVVDALELIQTTESMENFRDVDFVIEAASENKAVKLEIFKKLDQICPTHAILASNTSSISITEIAAATHRPSQVVGMHFMNPVPVMKLVEGIRGLETSDQAFEITKDLATSLDKVFIQAKDYPGFAVNRILMPMINEAIYALYEGVASASDIDQAMKLGTNQPMGPLELADFIGLDTCLAIMEVLYDGLGDSKYRPCPLLKQYVAAKRLGRKSKKGFYHYDK